MNQIIQVRVRRCRLKHVDGRGRIIRMTLCMLKIVACLLRFTAAGLDVAARWSEGR